MRVHSALDKLMNEFQAADLVLETRGVVMESHWSRISSIARRMDSASTWGEWKGGTHSRVVVCRERGGPARQLLCARGMAVLETRMPGPPGVQQRPNNSQGGSLGGGAGLPWSLKGGKESPIEVKV